MAVKFINPIDVEYKPLDLNVINQNLLTQQKYFDEANTKIAAQMDEAGKTSFLDPVAREKVLSDMNKSYQTLAEKYSGRLGENTPEVLRTISNNVSNPWFNLNTIQLTKAAEEQKLRDQYGAEAIVRSDVKNQKLYDPVTGQWMQPQDQRLVPNVVKAADYQQIGLQLGQWLTADAKDSLLKQYKNDPEVVGFLTSGRWEGISDAKLKKLVNDPAVQQAFKTQAATYAFDNRANVEYDPKTGTNIFTRQLSAKDQQQFSSGVSKYLYGVLKQKLFDRTSNNYMQDPDYERRLAAGAAAEQEKAIYDASLRESAINYATEGLGGYSPNFGKDGKIIMSADTPDNPFSLTSRYQYGRGAFWAEQDPASKSKTKQAQQAQSFINSMRKKFNIGANVSDENVWNSYAKSRSLGAASKDFGLAPDRAKVTVADLASAQGVKIQVEGDPKVYNLGDPEGQKEFEAKYKLTRDQLFRGDKTAFAAGAIRPLAQQTGDNNTRRGGVIIGQIYKPDGTAISATVTNDRIFTQAQYQPYNQAFEAARTMKPNRVQLGGELGDYMAVPYMDGQGQLSVMTLPLTKVGGKEKVLMVNSKGTRMAYGANSDELSKELSILSQLTNNDEEELAKALNVGGRNGITLETLAAKGHYNIASVNNFENLLHKGSSLTTDQMTKQLPSKRKP